MTNIINKYEFNTTGPCIWGKHYMLDPLRGLGGGRIDQEYAADRGRMDLAVEYNKRIYIIEIKIIHSHDSPDEVHDEGIAQIGKYRNSIDSTAPAYLVIFDRRPEVKQKPWDERLSWTQEAGITVLTC